MPIPIVDSQTPLSGLRSHGALKISISQISESLLRTPQHDEEVIKHKLTDPTTAEVLATKLLKSHFPNLPVDIELPTGEQCNPMYQLRMAAELLIEKGHHMEGIFRLTKSLDRPDILASQIASGSPVDMSIDSPYDLASMFKVYTRKYHPNLLTEADISSIIAKQNASEYMASLSAERREFLTLLIQLCRAIDANKEENKMDLSNIARVLGPNFFQHPEAKVEMRLIAPTIDAVHIILATA